MLDHFTSEEQKERCIHALELSIDMWGRMSPKWHDKIDMINAMREDGLLDENTYEYKPLNECFLCQFVDEETRNRICALIEQDAVQGQAYADSMAYYASGMDCARFCPVCWNKKENPENEELIEDTVCQQEGSPYQNYRFIDSAGGKRIQEKILKEMVDLLTESLKNVRDIPVRADIPERR